METRKDTELVSCSECNAYIFPDRVDEHKFKYHTARGQAIFRLENIQKLLAYECELLHKASDRKAGYEIGKVSFGLYHAIHKMKA